MDEKEMHVHVKNEWKQLTTDQQKRFLIPEEIQIKLKDRNQMSDVEVLRQLVLTQKLPTTVD